MPWNYLCSKHFIQLRYERAHLSINNRDQSLTWQSAQTAIPTGISRAKAYNNSDEGRTNRTSDLYR